MRRFCLIAVVVTAVLGHLSVQKAWGLATESIGNEPLSELNYARWKGIMPLVNDKARVYEIWVNGNEFFYYKGTTKEANAALANFKKVEIEHHIVVLRSGPAKRTSFDKTEIPYNWEMHIVAGLAGRFASDDIENIEWYKDPVLTIYVGEDIDREKLEIPMGMKVVDQTKKKETP